MQRHLSRWPVPLPSAQPPRVWASRPRPLWLLRFRARARGARYRPTHPQTHPLELARDLNSYCRAVDERYARMKTKVITFMLLLHLVVPSTVKTEMCDCPKITSHRGDQKYYDPIASSCLREALQAELTSTPSNIKELQNTFYSSNNVQRFYIVTDMAVNITCEPSKFQPVCNSSMQFSWTHLWHEDTIVGVISELITEGFFRNAVTAFLSLAQSFEFQVPDNFVHMNIQSNCASRGEPNQDEVENGMREIWQGILQWVSST